MGCYVHINDGRHTALVVHESKALIEAKMRVIKEMALRKKIKNQVQDPELRMAASELMLTGFESGLPVDIINPWSFISYIEEQDDKILLERMNEWKAAQEAKKEAMKKQTANPRLSIPGKRTN